MGSKRRYCRLLATVASLSTGAATTSAVSRVALVMLRQQAEPAESGRALDLATVTGVRLDGKVAARVLVQARQTHPHPEPRALPLLLPPPSVAAAGAGGRQARDQADGGDRGGGRALGRRDPGAQLAAGPLRGEREREGGGQRAAAPVGGGGVHAGP